MATDGEAAMIPITSDLADAVFITRGRHREVCGHDLYRGCALLMILSPCDREAEEGATAQEIHFVTIADAAAFIEHAAPASIAVEVAEGEDAKALLTALQAGAGGFH